VAAPVSVLLVLSAFAAALASLVFALALRVDRFARTLEPAPKGEVIVVLGAKLFSDGSLSPAFQGRVERAAELFEEKAAPLVLFSGGGAPSEARAALVYAQRLGLSASVCLLEEQSTNTLENARFTATLLAARGVKRIVLVSDGFHLLRAARCFELFGLEPVPAASRRVLMPRTRLLATLKEALAYLRLPRRRG
jgi:uncharacterized SAM-binding protein YcdF (DUF218 family)